MVTKDSNPLPTQLQTTSPDPNERVSNTTVTPPQTTPSADQGLTDLPVSPTKEPGKKQEVLQKAQLESKSAVKEVKKKTPPSTTTHMHRYALEVWIKAETSPGNFTPPEEESYSADFFPRYLKPHLSRMYRSLFGGTWTCHCILWLKGICQGGSYGGTEYRGM